jgi:hypothetical protein
MGDLEDSMDEKTNNNIKSKLGSIALQNMLEEYKQLRAEIRHLLERRSQNTNFAITITLGVIGIGIAIKNNIIFFTAFFLICVLWLDEIRRIRTIFRNAAFIETQIENRLDGLSWEKKARKHKIHESLLEGFFAIAIYPILLIIISVIEFSIPIDKQIISPLPIIILEIVFFLILTIYSVKVSRKGRKQELEEWERITKETNKID